MRRRIDTALDRLKQDLRPPFEESAVADICREAGHRWRRDALLTPFTTLLWFITQVLHGNTALTHITLKARRAFTESAYCQARSRLPLAVFRALLRFVIRALVPRTEAEGLWRGHRTFLIDGSSFSMPDAPELQQHFGQPGGQAPGCGFPVAKILAMFHAGTGLLMDVVAAPLRTHEMSRVDGVHPTLRPGDVLVGDRGFCSFAHLAMLISRGIHAVFRAHQKQIVDFTPGRGHARPGQKRIPPGTPRSRWIRAHGVTDQVVEYFKPEERPDWMSPEEYAALPDAIVVRELRYRVTQRGFRTHSVTLVTTLLDAEVYPLEALAELYATRWRVEQYLRDLKQTMKMDVLRCKTVEGVLKELMVYAIVYNLVRSVMGEAARRQRVSVDRISFIDALRWLLEAKPGEERPRLVINPRRPGRFEPRVRKRRPKPYPLMKKPRRELRKQLAEQDVAA
jgi:Transposase DDE domain